MKIIKLVVAVASLVVLVVAGVFFARSWVRVGNLMAAANANRPNPYPDVNRLINLTLAFATLGAFLLGLALGLPLKLRGRSRDRIAENDPTKGGRGDDRELLHVHGDETAAVDVDQPLKPANER